MKEKPLAPCLRKVCTCAICVHDTPDLEECKNYRRNLKSTQDRFSYCCNGFWSHGQSYEEVIDELNTKIKQKIITGGSE